MSTIIKTRTPLETVLAEPLINVDDKFPLAVPVNSYQNAIHICLELLGTTSSEKMVVLPITSSPDTISAVLRAGGYPCLLDINKDTLQIDPEVLIQVIEEAQDFILILNFPGGWDIDPNLQDLCRRYSIPTIIDSRLPASFSDYGPKGTFNIYDFSPILGCGGLIYPEQTNLTKELKLIRSGVLGLSAELVGTSSTEECLSNLKTFFTVRSKIFKEYVSILSAAGIKVKFDHYDRLVLIEHHDATSVVVKLYDYGFRANLGCVPLYKFEEIKSRWCLDPENSYPNAKEMNNKIVALPFDHDFSTKTMMQIAKAISEVI